MDENVAIEALANRQLDYSTIPFNTEPVIYPLWLCSGRRN